MSSGVHPVFWSVGEDIQPSPLPQASLWNPGLWTTVEEEINALDASLRELSLSIHARPELLFEEKHAHDVLTDYVAKQGFEVKRNYILPTGWEAKFTHGSGGRTIGVNSEMDALPGIGHACGHNLIAIAGVAVACAIKQAIVKHNISGTVILLGTPGEEGGMGKKIMLEAGAYKDMVGCVMCHPSPGPNATSSLSSTLAIQRVAVKYKGRSAHAALSPWEGQNALDAAVLAYNNIAALRQQLRPHVRVHGVFKGEAWTPNVIPDNAEMNWLVRSPEYNEVQQIVQRVKKCFEASALATDCGVEVDADPKGSMKELIQNKDLGEAFEQIFNAKYGVVDRVYGIASASTDFILIATTALPGIHPSFAIPTEPNGGNHTKAFTLSAASKEAHVACLNISKALALTGLRVLADDGLAQRVVAFHSIH
ncbi:hypothetical protein BDM02DRAFT_3087288 [Thelephora ganbajun]|uniref:Uncharacterized protein n=1 Tax=Thelephora ganbajun TaxID=370292 RepID=A0ACB6ZVF6_THEGA|nr:hypothetical protein BDM02DRAFT_3087288 [Thelephora ganbajun]